MHKRLSAAQRTNALVAGRRVLEVARRHTTEEVQELRYSLEAAKKELEAKAHLNSSGG